MKKPAVKQLLLVAVLGVVASIAPGGVAVARAQAPEILSLYDDGTRRLEQGDYAGAVEAYVAVLDRGTASSALYYNLGIAYYRLDRLGQSVRYFEKAALLDPDDRLIRHNLDIVRSKLTDRITRLPTPFWITIGRSVVRAFGVRGLFSVGIVAWFLLAASLVVAIRRGRFEPWVRRIAHASAAFAIFFLGAAFLASMVSPFGNRSVVVEDTVPLMSSAAGTDALQELHEGTVVDVIEIQGAWARVRLANGVVGWLEDAGLAGV